jgi:WD40 repeat protein
MVLPGCGKRQLAKRWASRCGIMAVYPVQRSVPTEDGVVTASWDGTARVWEAASGKPVSRPLRHNGAVNSAAFSPDGQWVVTASAQKPDALARPSCTISHGSVEPYHDLRESCRDLRLPAKCGGVAYGL